MARRARRAGRGRPRPRSTPGGPAAALRRLPRTLVLVLLLAAGAVALERAGLLPARAAEAVRRAEAWLAPRLRELADGAGIGPPPWVADGGAEPPPAPPSVPGQVDDGAAVAEALALLDRIPVAPERPRGYDRAGWPHWLDADGDYQDARDEVLMAESLGPVTLDVRGCNVAAGLWLDAYTGETHRDPTRLDVDRVVPLAEAHRSGGHAWAPERRAAFANDLADPRSLVAVSASANRSKGDQGPEEWLPPDPAYRCRHAADWVAVKARWELGMDERERVTVGNLLGGCARG